MGAENPVFSYEVTTRELAGLPDARGDSVKGMLASNYGVEVGAIRVILRYQVKAALTAGEAERAVYDLFADPVMEQGSVSGHLLDDPSVFPNAPT